MKKAIVINKGDVIPKETYYLLIVDSSTSMRHLSNSTISGVNEQIDNIRNLEREFPDQKYHMSFIHFNNKVTIEYFNKPSSSIKDINESNYNCSGTTALLDAIGVGVRTLNEKISSKILSGEASAVVVIITDGEENASLEFDSNKVKNMIVELQDTNKWTFTFIGANIDSISTATKYGIDKSNVMQFSGDVNSNSRVYKSMNRSFASRAASMDIGYFDSKDFLHEEDKDLTTK